MYDGIFKILHIEWGCKYPLQSCIKYRFSTTISIMCRVIRAKKSPCEDWLLFLIGQKRCSSRLVILNCHPHIVARCRPEIIIINCQTWFFGLPNWKKIISLPFWANSLPLNHFIWYSLPSSWMTNDHYDVKIKKIKNIALYPNRSSHVTMCLFHAWMHHCMQNFR